MQISVMRRRSARCVLSAALAVSGALLATSSAGTAAPAHARAAKLTPPDMRMVVLKHMISAAVDGSSTFLHFSHVTSDFGPGPFEIDPRYDSRTGVATFRQTLYNSPSPGVWRKDHSVPLGTLGVFTPPSDYQFPLNSFTLLNARGHVVATSPKTDYCITGDYRLNGVPLTPDQTFIDQSNCADPTRPLGWSLGWGDHYDQTDDGQPIDITGLADGTYTLRGIVDPEHVLTETNKTNDITDTVLTFGDMGTTNPTVTVGAQTRPALPLPRVRITSPTAGARVGGTVVLKARASARIGHVKSVQFIVDGAPLGAPDTSAPYRRKWHTGAAAAGRHVVTARVTTTKRLMNTAHPVRVTLLSKLGSLTVDRSATAVGQPTATVRRFSTVRRGSLLLAMVGADGPTGAAQHVTVSGGGLTWRLLRRANGQPGDAEVWRARAKGRLTGVRLRASAATSGYAVWLDVLALDGAGGVGRSRGSSAGSASPSVSFAASAKGAVGLAVGNDFDEAVSPTPDAGQRLLAQRLAASGDTYWSQGTTAGAQARGDTVHLSDSAPSGDRTNFVGFEVLPSATSRADRAAPTVALANPVASQRVSGTVPLAARVTGDVGIAAVRFYVDGRPVGVTRRAPYAVRWNTRGVSSGLHTVVARAVDRSGRRAATQEKVLVQNPAPPMTCFVVQSRASAHGSTTVTTPAFRTAVRGEVLLAMVSADGPDGVRQSATVRGGGLLWHRVTRANAQPGDAEVWTATVHRVRRVGPLTSRLAVGGRAQQLTVVALEGVDGVGARNRVSGVSGTPQASLTATGQAASLFFAVGSAGVAQRPLLPTGQIFAGRRVDADATFWSQYTNQAISPAGTSLVMRALRPASAPWDFVAVEAVGELE